MRVAVWLLLSALMFPSLGGLAQAWPPGAVSTENEPELDAWIAQALERSPSLQALREKIAAAREMIAPAGALPNPMAETMLQNVGFPRLSIGTEEMSMLSLSVRQNLPYPGKRQARRKSAESEAAVSEREYEILKRTLVEDLRRMWADLYAKDDETASLKAGRELLDLLAAAASSRYAAGQADQEALLKAQLMVLKLEARRDDLTAERRKTVAAVNRILDRPGEQPLGTVSRLPELTLPGDSWTESALRNSPEIAMKQAEVELAERRSKIAGLDARPDFGAATGYGYREGFYPVVTLGFSVEFPLWKKDKQRPMIRAAEHELEMARCDLKAAEAGVRSSMASLTAESERLDAQIERYAQGIVPATSRAVDAALASYIAGRGDFAAMVEDFMLWLDARVELARLKADRFSTRAAVATLILPADSISGR